MTDETSNSVKSHRRISKLRVWLVGAVQPVVYAVILFASAGRLDLPMFWAYLLAHWGLTLAGGLIVIKRHPQLVQERRQPGPDAKEKLIVLQLFNHATWIANLIIAGLDVGRFHWSGNVPLPVQIIALLAFCLAMGLAISTVVFNPFASSVIRLQKDRGHYVVTTGPYRWVRHPMYLGCALMGPLAAITLGSWWAILPNVPAIGFVIWRTANEDRFLHAELEGYTQYSQRVRYRLVPGIW